jgi:creatinine amidohydrolase
VAGRLNSEWKGTNTRVYAIREYYLAATTDFATLLTARGLSREEIGTHAGVADTSLMLAIDPTLVRPEQLRSGRKFERSDGVYGDPRRSTAELGRLGTELIVNRTVDTIRAAISIAISRSPARQSSGRLRRSEPPGGSGWPNWRSPSLH